MRPLLAALLSAAFAFAAPVPKAAKKKDDATLIVGSWKPTDQSTCHYEFKADGTMRTWHVPEVGPPIDWTYTLEPDATPVKRMKLVTADGKNSYDCVYSLDGDRLKVGFILGVQQVREKWEETPGIQLYDQTRDTSSK